MVSIEELPNEILILIADFLDLKDLCGFRSISSFFYSIYHDKFYNLLLDQLQTEKQLKVNDIIDFSADDRRLTIDPFRLCGETLVSFCIKKQLFIRVDNFLNDPNFSIDAYNILNENLLYLACMGGNLALVINLMSKMPNPTHEFKLLTQVFNNRFTCLHAAVISRNIDLVRYLVETKGLVCVINILDNFGCTPLDYTDQQCEEIFKYLIEMNAKVFPLESYQEHCMTISSFWGIALNGRFYSIYDLEAAEMHLNKGDVVYCEIAEENSLLSNSNQEKVRRVIAEKCASINLGEFGRFAYGDYLTLDGAYESTYLHKILKGRNPNISILQKVIESIPIAHLSLRLSRAEYLKSPLHMVSAHGGTLPHLKLFLKQFKKISSLEERKKHLDKKDLFGKTPLAMAIQGYNERAVEALIKAGASFAEVDLITKKSEYYREMKNKYAKIENDIDIKKSRSNLNHINKCNQTLFRRRDERPSFTTFSHEDIIALNEGVQESIQYWNKEYYLYKSFFYDVVLSEKELIDLSDYYNFMIEKLHNLNLEESLYNRALNFLTEALDLIVNKQPAECPKLG